jgi:hypothetical protein
MTDKAFNYDKGEDILEDSWVAQDQVKTCPNNDYGASLAEYVAYLYHTKFRYQ